MKLVAIDFETADHGADSACAVGLVSIEAGRISQSLALSIRPPRSDFKFSHIHGIRWGDVRDEPAFADLWPVIEGFCADANFFLAHNAGFDRGVLRACCHAAGLPAPSTPFVCTVRLARAAWNLRPTRLPDVCRHLVIPLRHHDALSDARACAEIALAAMADGVDLDNGRV